MSATISRPAQLFQRRWTPERAASAIREFGSLASYADLHDLTPKISGTNRMALFDDLAPATQKAMAASLHAALERERGL